MDHKAEMREFLASRRARITPEQAGLTVYGKNRRVTGLRREEVAMLAGISVEYYTRLERGNANGASEDVLEGIARALQLDEAERSHLFDLARSASTTRVVRRRPSHEQVRPNVQRIVDAITEMPADVRNARLDILYSNPLARALYTDAHEDSTRPTNVARFIFLNSRSEEFFDDWNGIANDAVAILRAEAGRDPYDRRLTDLIGELSTRSEEFRVRWADHNVKLHNTGAKTFHHPIVGELTLAYEALEIATDPGQRLLIYTAEPNSPSQEALNLLASWTSTPTDTSTTDISERQ